VNGAFAWILEAHVYLRRGCLLALAVRVPSGTGVPEGCVPGVWRHGRLRWTILASRTRDETGGYASAIIVCFCMMRMAHAYDSRSVGGGLATAETAIAVEAGE
jgi:hypothetical protein